MSDTVLNSVGKEDAFKKRRVWTAKPKFLSVTKNSYATACKHKQTEVTFTLQATYLVSQHLVGTTPEPWTPN